MTMSGKGGALEGNVFWTGGNAVFFLAAMFYVFFGYVTLYRIAALAMLVALVTEIYLPMSSLPPAAMAEKFFLNECSPYAVVAGMMYLMTPVPLMLIPFFVMCVFKLISFARNYGPIKKHPFWTAYGQHSAEQILLYRPTLLSLTSHFELAMMPYLLISVFSVGISWPLVWMSFLRWQYFVSARNRLTCALWDEAMGGLVKHPNCPVQVRNAYAVFRAYVARMVRIPGVNMPPAASPAAAAPNATAAPRPMPPVGRR